MFSKKDLDTLHAMSKRLEYNPSDAEARAYCDDFKYRSKVAGAAEERIKAEKSEQLRQSQEALQKARTEAFEGDVNSSVNNIKYAEMLTELDVLRKQHIEAAHSLDSQLTSKIASQVFALEEKINAMKQGALTTPQQDTPDTALLKQRYIELSQFSGHQRLQVKAELDRIEAILRSQSTITMKVNILR